MKASRFVLGLGLGLCAFVSAFAQGTLVISDPTTKTPDAVTDNTSAKLLPGDQRLMDTQVLPKVRKKLVDDVCKEEIVLGGEHEGYFTQSKEPENVVFYQFCETGNGLGKAGVFIFKGETLVANFVAENAGWAVDSEVLPDINKDGLDEIALYYSGGMHQGQGGTGVDIVQYSAGKLKGVGWYQSDGFDENTSWSWKITVNPGKTPVFFKEKFVSSGKKWRKSGKVLPLKLEPAIATFEAVK